MSIDAANTSRLSKEGRAVAAEEHVRSITEALRHMQGQVRSMLGVKAPQHLTGLAGLTGVADRAEGKLTGLYRSLSLRRLKIRAKEMAMKWKTPVIIEIAVGLEINAYACAEVK